MPMGEERAGLGSDASLDEVFRQHVVPEIAVLLRVANSLTDQPADAEDLVQDTLIRAYGRCTGSTGSTRGRGC